MTGCGRAVAEQDKAMLPPTLITDISGGATVNFGIPMVKEFSNKLYNVLHIIMFISSAAATAGREPSLPYCTITGGPLSLTVWVGWWSARVRSALEQLCRKAARKQS